MKGGSEMDGRTKMRLAGPDEIQKEVERFFEHLGRWKRPLFFYERAWKPLCDVSETDEEVIIVADLGNVSAENIEIKVEAGKLILRGVRREPSSAPQRNYRQMEISYGPFERVMSLFARVDPGRASAVYEDGFLEIRLPKVSKEPPRAVEIDVSTE
jgi:HSP20 family protein